jgi:hypothetical protein
MDENEMGRDSGKEGSAEREKTCIHKHVHSHTHTRTNTHTSAYHALNYTLLHIPYHPILSHHSTLTHTYTTHTHNKHIMPHNTVQHIQSHHCTAALTSTTPMRPANIAPNPNSTPGQLIVWPRGKRGRQNFNFNNEMQECRN